MLDFTAGLKLRAVAQRPQDDHESPALEQLLHVGFVARDGGAVRLTETGRLVLEADASTTLERWAWRIGALCAAFLALSTVVGWFV